MCRRLWGRGWGCSPALVSRSGGPPAGLSPVMCVCVCACARTTTTGPHPVNRCSHPCGVHSCPAHCSQPAPRACSPDARGARLPGFSFRLASNGRWSSRPRVQSPSASSWALWTECGRAVFCCIAANTCPSPAGPARTRGSALGPAGTCHTLCPVLPVRVSLPTSARSSVWPQDPRFRDPRLTRLLHRFCTRGLCFLVTLLSGKSVSASGQSQCPRQASCSSGGRAPWTGSGVLGTPRVLVSLCPRCRGACVFLLPPRLGGQSLATLRAGTARVSTLSLPLAGLGWRRALHACVGSEFANN